MRFQLEKWFWLCICTGGFVLKLRSRKLQRQEESQRGNNLEVIDRSQKQLSSEDRFHLVLVRKDLGTRGDVPADEYASQGRRRVD